MFDVIFINSIVFDWEIIQIFLIRYFSRFNSIKFFRYVSLPKLNWKVDILIMNFKVINFFLVKKERNIITIVMQTQAKFCLSFSKTNTNLFLCSTNVAINIISCSFTKHLNFILEIIITIGWTIINTKTIIFLAKLLQKPII